MQAKFSEEINTDYIPVRITYSVVKTLLIKPVQSPVLDTCVQNEKGQQSRCLSQCSWLIGWLITQLSEPLHESSKGQKTLPWLSGPCQAKGNTFRKSAL